MKKSHVKTILANHNLELEDFTKSIIGKTLQQYENGETNYPFALIQQFITNNINVNLSNKETAKLIAHHLQTAVKSLNQAKKLIEEIGLENENIYHFTNAVDISDCRQKIERILNRDYKQLETKN